MKKKKQEATLCIIPHSPLPAPTSSVELSLRGIVKSLFHPFQTWIQFSLPLHVLPGLLGLLQDQFKKRKKENDKRQEKNPQNPLTNVGGLSFSSRALRC